MLNLFPHFSPQFSKWHLIAYIVIIGVPTPTISLKIFWDFLMFYQIFLSLQVKRWAIITYKHGMYELPNDLES